jgi:hypothetical protein
VKRRDFITLIGGAAAAWPLAAHAQQSTGQPLVGLLSPLSAAAWVHILGAPLAARAQQPAMPVIEFLINGAPDVYAEPLAMPWPEDQYRSCGVSGKGWVSEEI